MNNTKDYHIVTNLWGWNIEQENLYYTDMGNMVGLQCNSTEHDPNYKKIAQLCDTILKCITEIEEINEGTSHSTRIQRTLEGIRAEDQLKRKTYSERKPKFFEDDKGSENLPF